MPGVVISPTLGFRDDNLHDLHDPFNTAMYLLKTHFNIGANQVSTEANRHAADLAKDKDPRKRNLATFGRSKTLISNLLGYKAIGAGEFKLKESKKNVPTPLLDVVVELLRKEGIVYDDNNKKKFFKDEASGAIYGRLVMDGELTESFIMYHSNARNYDLIFEKILSAKQTIRILHTCISGAERFAQAFESALKRGVSHEILIVEPWSDAIRNRSRTVSKQDNDFEQEAVQSYIKLAPLAKKYPDLFTLHTIHHQPPHPFFQIDDTVFTGHYWSYQKAKDGAWMEFSGIENLVSSNPLLSDNLKNFERELQMAKSFNDGFSVRYIVHLYREGVLCERELKINPDTFEAILTNTYNEVDFHGVTIDIWGDSCTINMGTRLSHAIESKGILNEKRTCTFKVIGLDRTRLNQTRIAVGKFLVHFANGEIRSNIVLLENMSPKSIGSNELVPHEDEKKLLIRNFMEKSHEISMKGTVEVVLTNKVSTWSELKRAVEA